MTPHITVTMPLDSLRRIEAICLTAVERNLADRNDIDVLFSCAKTGLVTFEHDRQNAHSISKPVALATDRELEKLSRDYNTPGIGLRVLEPDRQRTPGRLHVLRRALIQKWSSLRGVLGLHETGQTGQKQGAGE